MIFNLGSTQSTYAYKGIYFYLFFCLKDTETMAFSSRIKIAMVSNFLTCILDIPLDSFVVFNLTSGIN